MMEYHTRANEVAEQLIGTCKSLSDFATEEEIDSVEFCSAVDCIVMCCVSCGWWTEESDVNDESVCSECLND